MKLSIIVPCYNEAENIPLILDRFAQVIGSREIELVMVNNGSTDNSSQVLEKLLPKYPFARVVDVPINQGYGYGVLQGLAQAEGEFLGWTHADMQTDPGDVIRAWDLVAEKDYKENIMVKGSRCERPLFDQFFSIGMGIFESLYLGQYLWEINAQPNIFHRSFYIKWQNPPYDFALDLYVMYMARKSGLDIRRIKVAFPQRIHGSSKWNTGLASKWKFIQRTLKFSIALKKRGIE